MNYTFSPLQMGWCCPKCGRVYSPTQMMCLYCGGDKSDQPSNGIKNSITTVTLNGVANLPNCFTEGSWTYAFYSK